jgi:hypothetical protein
VEDVQKISVLMFAYQSKVRGMSEAKQGFSGTRKIGTKEHDFHKVLRRDICDTREGDDMTLEQLTKFCNWKPGITKEPFGIGKWRVATDGVVLIAENSRADIFRWACRR